MEKNIIWQGMAWNGHVKYRAVAADEVVRYECRTINRGEYIPIAEISRADFDSWMDERSAQWPNINACFELGYFEEWPQEKVSAWHKENAPELYLNGRELMTKEEAIDWLVESIADNLAHWPEDEDVFFFNPREYIANCFDGLLEGPRLTKEDIDAVMEGLREEYDGIKEEKINGFFNTLDTDNIEGDLEALEDYLEGHPEKEAILDEVKGRIWTK